MEITNNNLENYYKHFFMFSLLWVYLYVYTYVDIFEYFDELDQFFFLTIVVNIIILHKKDRHGYITSKIYKN